MSSYFKACSLKIFTINCSTNTFGHRGTNSKWPKIVVLFVSYETLQGQAKGKPASAIQCWFIVERWQLGAKHCHGSWGMFHPWLGGGDKDDRKQNAWTLSLSPPTLSDLQLRIVLYNSVRVQRVATSLDTTNMPQTSMFHRPHLMLDVI